MKLIFSIFMVVMSTTLFSQSVTDNFEGKWKTSKGEVIIISKKGDIFEGVATKNGNSKVILSNIAFTGEKWKGRLAKPKDGTKLDCELKLKGSELIIKVKKGFVSKTLIWKK